MRFNVVIGGQMLSKSDRGFVTFHFEFLAKEGVLPAILILIAPFVVYYILNRFIPIFDDQPIAGLSKSKIHSLLTGESTK
jgi:hypothetical protein